MASTMNVDEYKRQLADLTTRGGIREWPYKSVSDQHVLMKSATYSLEADRDYSEQELNDLLGAWCEQVAGNMQIDHASLRRHMVEAGYLRRDAAGYRYRLDDDQATRLFERDVSAIDPVVVVREALKEIEARKQRYLNSK
jgi:hypothetical protein